MILIRGGVSGVPRRPALPAVAIALALSSCATPEKHPPPAQPPPATQVFFYPTRGQGVEQQQRDRYECYLWAKKQSGFDPSQPLLAPHQRFEVVPSPPPGHDTAVGAVTGAVLGAVVSPPGRTAEGAAIGAVAGAAVGATSDVARQQAAERTQRRVDARLRAQLEQQAADYRRAMTACLEGRGYTVR